MNFESSSSISFTTQKALQEHYAPPGVGPAAAVLAGLHRRRCAVGSDGIYFFTPGSSANPPAFVYGIFFSLFVFFNVFALNMWLRYKRIGPWRNYVFGESVYIALSLTAKSALAWQVFFPTLMG
jgi:hypothetical protein